MTARYTTKLDFATLLEDPHPDISLDWETCSQRMTRFSQRLRDLVNNANTAIAAKREEHTTDVKRIAAKAAVLEEQTRAAKVREIELAAELEKEREEEDKAEEEVNGLKRQVEILEMKVTSVDDQNSQTRAHLEDLRREKARDKNILEAHALAMKEEYDALSQSVGVRIEGVGREALLFTFMGAHPSDPARECSFALDLSGDVYRVLASEPVLPGMSALVAEANATGDVWRFVLKARTAFVTAFTSAGA